MVSWEGKLTGRSCNGPDLKTLRINDKTLGIAFDPNSGKQPEREQLRNVELIRPLQGWGGAMYQPKHWKTLVWVLRG